jgi:hypothetical protein
MPFPPGTAHVRRPFKGGDPRSFPMSDSPSLTGCSISSEVVPPHSLPMIGLVKISTNWAGWAPEFLITLRTEHYEVEPPSVLKRLLRHSKHNCQPPLYGVDNSGGHLRGGVPIVGAHGAASLLAAATGGFVAHPHVDDPGGDGSVLSPVVKVCRRSCGPRRSKWPRSAPAASTAALETRRRLLTRPGAETPTGAAAGATTTTHAVVLATTNDLFISAEA